MREQYSAASVAAALLSLLGLAGASAAQAQDRPVPDTYTAITTNMTPADVELKADILSWSDDEARAAVVAALTAEGDADDDAEDDARDNARDNARGNARGDEEDDATSVAEALSELPTIGVVWRSGSAVGHAIKYAHRTETPDGERITLVTDRVIGASSFKPWTAGDATVGGDLGFSVVELNRRTDGAGDGTLSLAAEVVVDPATNTISLSRADSAPMLLTDVRLEPKPYWARED